RFGGHRIPGGPQTVLRPAGCGPDVATVEDVPVLREIQVHVVLEVTDPRFPVLLELLRQHDEDPSLRYRDRYTEEELDSARLLVLHPNRECEPSGGVKWGMTYDLSAACPACGTGARQTSAVFLDGEELSDLEGHRACGTIFFHILLDEGLAAELERVGASGL